MREQQKHADTFQLDTASVESCSFNFFAFHLPLPWILRVPAQLITGLDLPPVLNFPGLPLTQLQDLLEAQIYDFVTESGLFGLVPPVCFFVWDWVLQRRRQEASNQEREQERQKAIHRNMMEEVQFTLCMMVDDPLRDRQEFKQATLFEVKLSQLVKEQDHTAEAVREAAKKTTKEYSFLHCLDKKYWTSVRGMILNELSSRFSKGYLAEELGVATEKQLFWFGLTNEQGSTTAKLRVIVASDKLLHAAHQMNSQRPPIEPEFDKPYLRKRWGTVCNMAALHADQKNWTKGNEPLRQIELCLPKDSNLDPTSSKYLESLILNSPRGGSPAAHDAIVRHDEQLRKTKTAPAPTTPIDKQDMQSHVVFDRTES
jgi:hypothetical protein